MEIEDFKNTADLEKFLFESATNLHCDLVSPIHDAAARGNLFKLKLLVRKAKEDASEEGSEFPLSDSADIALKEEDFEINPELLNQQDAVQNTPLHWAAGAGQVEVMQFLLHHDCQINPRNALGDTPLHRAVWRNHVEAVELLLEKDADPAIINRDNMKPMDLARSAQIKEILRGALAKAFVADWSPDEESSDGTARLSSEEDSDTENSQAQE